MTILKAAEQMKSLTYVMQVPVVSTKFGGSDENGRTVGQIRNADFCDPEKIPSRD